MYEFGIRSIYLNITTACNLRCHHCFIEAGLPQQKELSVGEIENILDDAAQIGTKKVIFTGGEPTIHPDFVKLSAHANNLKGMGIDKLALVTNCMLINQELSEIIAEVFDVVNISIDGQEFDHDSIRGRGSFEGTIKGMRSLVRAGVDPTIFITETSQNSNNIEALIRLLYQTEGVNKFKVRTIWEFGRAKKYHHLIPKKNTDLDPSVSYVSKCISATEKYLGYSINIHSDGLVYPCHLLKYPEFIAGNLCKNSLSNVFYNSPVFNALRKLDFECCQQIGYSRKLMGALLSQG